MGTMAPSTSGKTPEPIILAVEPFGGSLRNHSPLLPLVYWDDAAVTRGDGVFETILLRGGRACNLQRHAERFRRSAALMGLPEPQLQDWFYATKVALEQWSSKSEADAKCVWTYTRGRPTRDPQQPHPSAWLTVTAVPQPTLAQREAGVKVCTASRGYTIEQHENAPWTVVGAKTLNYATNMAALRWAQEQGFDDVIFTEGDMVLEGATSTVVTFRGNKIRTPGSPNLLPGTTQAALFEYAQAQGWNCKPKEMDLEYLVDKADSVWLVSAVRVAARVRRVNEQKLAKPENEDAIRRLILESLSV